MGPNPTDRGKQGPKHHLIVDGQGTPLAAVLSGAHRHDSKLLEAAVDAIPPVRNGKPGRPRCRPEKVHADTGYDRTFCREALRKQGIIPRIARRGIDSRERAGGDGALRSIDVLLILRSRDA